MFALERSLSRLSLRPFSTAIKATSNSQLKHYATISTQQSATEPAKPRHRDLNLENKPHLDKIDSILDYSPEPPLSHLDQPKLFPSHRPTEMMLNNDRAVNLVDTALTPEEQSKLLKKAIVVKRVTMMNAKGRQKKMYALVLVGNGKGLAGYGEGKDEETNLAIRKATNRAIRNLQYFERYDDRTVAHDILHKFHATRIELRARQPGFGIRANHVIHEICKCIGIQDISGKVRGSKSPMNVLKATFEAFQQQRMPEDIAKIRGKKISDIQHVYFDSQ